MSNKESAFTINLAFNVISIKKQKRGSRELERQREEEEENEIRIRNRE